MALTSGTRLGAYEIAASIGAGGMGEVFRARDTRLNRDVALKVLPETFLLDPEHLARFRREAQVLASERNRKLRPPVEKGVHLVAHDERHLARDELAVDAHRWGTSARMRRSTYSRSSARYRRWS